MIRLLVLFLCGVIGGGALVWKLAPTQAPRVAVPQSTVEPLDRACADELAAARVELAELRGRLSAARDERAPEVSSPYPVSDFSAPQHASSTGESSAADAVKWKVSAIEKFVPLNDEQRQKLRDKFEREAGVPSGENPGTESLEEIIGEDNARFYRQQVKAAFERVQEEEIDREIVWLSRQLALSQDQEAAVRSVFEVVERQIDEEGAVDEQNVARSPGERVKAMVAENRKRTEFRNEQLKPVLSGEQYEAYLRTQAESSASDVELFHN